MRVTSFLPHLKSIKVESVTVADHGVILRAATTRKRGQCPLCQRWSKRMHSRYWRVIADQPWAGRPVAIRLRVRRFFCFNRQCPQRIFTERLPDLVDSYGRRSQPLRAALRRVGLAVGARAGARLAVPLGMPISARSLLRVVHRTPLPTAELARVIAIDDWAWRKGQRYGTVIVDLERRRPIDLLPDRAAETVVAWLRAHPQVAVIARDRGVMYIDGATRGAPDAIQVVDRWHMAKNLGEALERLFARKQDVLAAMARELARTETAETAVADAAPTSTSMSVAGPRGTRARRDRDESAHRRAARLERFMTVRNLSAQGLGQMAITRSSKCPPMAQRSWCQEQLFLDPRAPTCVDRPLLRSDSSRSALCVTLVSAKTSVTAINGTRPCGSVSYVTLVFAETSVTAPRVTWPLRVSVIPLAMLAAPLSFHGARRCTRPRRADQERNPAAGRCTAPVRPVAVDLRLLMGHARWGPAAHARALSCGRSGRYG